VDALEITASVQDGRDVIAVGGDIDITTQRQFADAIAARLAAGRALVLDLTGIGFVDSSGLRALLKAARDARIQQTALTIAASPAVYRVLELAQVTHVLSLHPDRAAAVAACV
jgi:anti-anti-sigma factor